MALATIVSFSFRLRPEPKKEKVVRGETT